MSYYDDEDQSTTDSRDLRGLHDVEKQANWYSEDTETDVSTRNDEATAEDDTSTTNGRGKRPKLDMEAVEREQQANPNIVTEEITRDLREFITLCEQIKAAKEELKGLVELKTELEVKISEFMITHDIPAFKTPNGQISVVQAKSVKPLNKEFFRDTISAKIADMKIVDELTEMAFSGRPTVQTRKIKVTPSKRN